jgi:hypothetical protein
MVNRSALFLCWRLTRIISRLISLTTKLVFYLIAVETKKNFNQSFSFNFSKEGRLEKDYKKILFVNDSSVNRDSFTGETLSPKDEIHSHRPG